MLPATTSTTNLILTKHAKFRMADRIITLQDIYNCVKSGTPSPAKNGLLRYTYQNIYVILDASTKTVVTCCFTKSYTKKIEKFAKSNNLGFYTAVKKVRGVA